MTKKNPVAKAARVTEPAGLEDHLGYRLRLVSNHVSHAFRLKVETHGVTVAEWVVLRMLFDVERLGPSELAERMGMTRGAVSKLVERLTTKRLTTCRTEKGDRRFQSLALTPAGRKLVPVLARLADENDGEFFGHLTPEQRATFDALLLEVQRRRPNEQVPVD